MSNQPAWFTHLIDQRMALIEDKVSVPATKLGKDLIMTPLTEPDVDTIAALDQWENTCDNPGCRKVTPLHSGSAIRYTKNGAQVVMTFGVCPDCAKQFKP